MKTSKKLKEYRSKRNLKTSKEPKAVLKKGKKGLLHFVVHKHAATRLHYDLRLEVGGVLKSWAVPKGPSLNPEDRRLAVMVEDHPYDYKDFEGIIPSGYGAGEVMIWDQGTYFSEEPEGSEKRMKEGLKKGSVHITLMGKKLKGEFTLVRFKPEENQWLLTKKKDAHASKTDVTKKKRSVVSNLTLEGIAKGLS